MSRTPTPRARLALLAGALAAATLAAPGAAALPKDKALCLEAYEGGQRLRADGQLRAARERLGGCTASACPAAMAKECAGWIAELDATTPTVLVHARLGGAEVTDVRVLVDGEPRAARLDGAAIALDPGERRFRFEVTGAPAVEEVVLVRAGDARRVLDVDLGGGAAPPRFAWPELTLAAVGVAGLAAFAVAGGLGVARYRELRGSCAPACADADAADVRTKLLVADVSLGVGLAAIGGAAITWLVRARHAPAAPSVTVAPTAGGAMGVAGFRF